MSALVLRKLRLIAYQLCPVEEAVRWPAARSRGGQLWTTTK